MREGEFPRQGGFSVNRIFPAMAVRLPAFRVDFHNGWAYDRRDFYRMRTTGVNIERRSENTVGGRSVFNVSGSASLLKSKDLVALRL